MPAKVWQPRSPSEVALVLIGAKGAGKGTLIRCLELIFGAHAFQVTSREEVIGSSTGICKIASCLLPTKLIGAVTSGALVAYRSWGLEGTRPGAQRISTRASKLFHIVATSHKPNTMSGS
jgi:ABC-type cobalamin/Fe3+-siderophores transport system ATPase subunit